MGDGAGFVEDDSCCPIQFFNDVSIFQVEAFPSKLAHGAAKSKGNGERQCAGTSNNEY